MAEGNIGLAEPSTITKSLRSVSQTINSSVVHQEVMTIGSQGAVAGSSLGLAEVLASAPASTTWGLAVRIAGGPSSAVDLQARVNQGVGNSSNGDAWAVNVKNSSGVISPTNPFSVSLQLSTLVFGTFAASTVGNTSTQTVLISSAAGTPFVTSYVATSTEVGPIVGGFYVGSTLLWPVILSAGLGQIQQAQGPSVAPNYVFAGQAGRPLHFVTGSSGVTVQLALTYFTA